MKIAGHPPHGRAEHRFARLDSNADGKLDDNELQRMAQHLSNKTGRNISADDIRARLDKNGDGAISLEELKSAQGPRARGRRRGPDKNGDGRLDDHELQRMSEHLSAKTGQNVSVENLKTILDGNGDGLISIEEARKVLPPPRRGGLGGAQGGVPQDAFDTSASLSPDVIGRMAAGLSQVLGEDVSAAQLSAALDLNGDGSVDKQEVHRLMMQARMKNM